LQFRHAPGLGLPDDPPAIDQPEAFGNLFIAGFDVGADAGSAQAIERAF
jgi:hypothetical protein